MQSPINTFAHRYPLTQTHTHDNICTINNVFHFQTIFVMLVLTWILEAQDVHSHALFSYYRPDAHLYIK